MKSKTEIVPWADRFRGLLILSRSERTTLHGRPLKAGKKHAVRGSPTRSGFRERRQRTDVAGSDSLCRGRERPVGGCHGHLARAPNPHWRHASGTRARGTYFMPAALVPVRHYGSDGRSHRADRSAGIAGGRRTRIAHHGRRHDRRGLGPRSAEQPAARLATGCARHENHYSRQDKQLLHTRYLPSKKARERREAIDQATLHPAGGCANETRRLFSPRPGAASFQPE
jgi:hypothetical protein